MYALCRSEPEELLELGMLGTKEHIEERYIPEFLHSDDNLNELRMDLGESLWLKLNSEQSN